MTHRHAAAACRNNNNIINMRVLIGMLCVLLCVGSTLSARPHYNRYQKWKTHRGDTNYVKSRSKVSPVGQGIENGGHARKESGHTGVRDLLQFYRGVPRSQWSCCMLGRLAGEKGFHCHAQFYRSNIYLRNRNRAHNKKLNLHGPNPNPRFGKKLMYTLRKCVGKRSHVFHKCCYGAVMEWRHQRLWQTHNRLPLAKYTANKSYKKGKHG